jgi:uncharacterized protein YggE
VGVSTTAPHAAQALEQNNTLAAAVQKALEADGVAPADVQTTGLSLQQNWGSGAPNGYAVYDEVTASIRGLARAGTIIDDALAAAGDAGRLAMVSFSMSDTNPLMAAARQQAVASAKAQAQQMASAAGEHLGQLISLDSEPQSPQYPSVLRPAASAAAGVSAAPVPIQPGEQQVTFQVTGVWQVVPA